MLTVEYTVGYDNVGGVHILSPPSKSSSHILFTISTHSPLNLPSRCSTTCSFTFCLMLVSILKRMYAIYQPIPAQFFVAVHHDGRVMYKNVGTIARHTHKSISFFPRYAPCSDLAWSGIGLLYRRHDPITKRTMKNFQRYYFLS